jgi:excisionase family DNA binding protein
MVADNDGHVKRFVHGGTEVEKLLLKVPEAAELCGLGRSKLYELMQAGEIPVIRIGRGVRIPASGLRAWVARQGKSASDDIGT